MCWEELRRHRRERLRQGTLEPWAWETMDELNAGFDRAIAGNRRAEPRSGPKKSRAIPPSNGTRLVGDVGAKGILFQGQCRRSGVTVASLTRFLESLNMGNVEIIDHGPDAVLYKLITHGK